MNIIARITGACEAGFVYLIIAIEFDKNYSKRKIKKFQNNLFKNDHLSLATGCYGQALILGHHVHRKCFPINIVNNKIIIKIQYEHKEPERKYKTIKDRLNSPYLLNDKIEKTEQDLENGARVILKDAYSVTEQIKILSELLLDVNLNVYYDEFLMDIKKYSKPMKMINSAIGYLED